VLFGMPLIHSSVTVTNSMNRDRLQSPHIRVFFHNPANNLWNVDQ
jgi:hypothetical protein